MVRICTAFLLAISLSGYAQTMTVAQQTVLNNYVNYLNKSQEDITYLGKRVTAYYQRLPYFKKKTQRPSFTCEDQLNEYYFKQAIAGVGGLANANILKAKAQEVQSAAEAVDGFCKALDTYHKLQDYERDNFQQGDEILKNFQTALVQYRAKYEALTSELLHTADKLQANVFGPYRATDVAMKKEIAREKALLDLWSVNVNEDIHTGYPVDQIQASILDTDKAIQAFDLLKPSLQYPASSIYDSFKEAMQQVLETKRQGLDGYNYEAKQSDRFSNQVYLDLINYYNGMLVADNNTFIQFSMNDKGYYGLASVAYVPLFENRTKAEAVNYDVKPFEDKVRIAINPTRSATAIPKPLFIALGNYVEFINETLLQGDNLRQVLRNFNDDAAYYKGLTSYKGKGGLKYKHDDFQVPLSYYQTAIAKSEAIPVAYRKSLNEQAEVLLNIMKEIDALSVALETETHEKRYEKDNLKRIYEILERYAMLFDILDLKKEQLYLDVRSIYESFNIANASNSWWVSNKALLGLMDEDKKQLFKARAFIKGDSSSLPSADVVESLSRKAITDEFANMKGIERLGPYNGNCPYTPYEAIPTHSRTLAEVIRNIKKEREETYDGPYHDFIYLYNAMEEQYEKFCELAKVDILKNIRQPGLFKVEYPVRKLKDPDDDSVLPGQDVPDPNATIPSKDLPVLVPAVGAGVVATGSKKTGADGQSLEIDTVYIEKHDTVYMDAGGDPHSMEGYAINNLVFLLDVSGSMGAEQRLPLLKKSMINLVNMYRPEDRLSIVVYSGKAKVILQPTSAEEKQKIIHAIETLDSDGQTDAGAGLELAYKVADENYLRGGNNRVLLATDGDFSINNAMTRLISKSANQDIFLSVFVFGNGSTKLQNLAKLAAIGQGHYENITPANADAKLVREAKARKK